MPKFINGLVVQNDMSQKRSARTRSKARSGDKHYRLTFVGPSAVRDPRGKHVWDAICDCGNRTLVHPSKVISGGKKSCGCFRKETMSARQKTHGRTKTREHRIWGKIKERCYDPSHVGYKHYGARGITICERWLNSFESFLADMEDCPTGFSIDRIDNDGDYKPGNCVWADVRTQARNKTTSRKVLYQGRTMNVRDFENELDLPISYVYKRTKIHGESHQQAADHFVAVADTRFVTKTRRLLARLMNQTATSAGVAQ